MAILIPSKNIYKKQNEKIIDNDIHKIEINAKTPKIVQETNTSVFSETKNVELVFEKVSGGLIKDTNIGIGNAFVYAFNYLTYRYAKFEVTIPKLKNNKVINKFYYNKFNEVYDKEEDTLIKISFYGDVERGIVNQSIDGSPKDYNVSITAEYKEKETNVLLQEKPLEKYVFNAKEWGGDYVNNLEVVANYNDYNEDGDIEYIDGNLYTNMTILHPLVKYEGENVKFTFYVATGYEQLYGGACIQQDDEFGEGVPPKKESTAIIVMPKRAEITINGDTIGVDLTDQLLEIQGDSGQSKKVFSVDSNELMQTTNYYIEPFPISDLQIEYYYDNSVEKGKVKFADNTPRDFDVEIKVNQINNSTNAVERETILKIYKGNTESNSIVLGGVRRLQIVQTNDVRHNALINTFSNTENQYKLGKETATLLCDINDYYIYGLDKSNNNLAKTTQKIDITNLVNVEFSFSPILLFSILKATSQQTFNLPINVVVEYETTIGEIKTATVQIKSNEIVGDTNLIGVVISSIISWTATLQVNMLFDIYDEVIPMVFGANGKDVPLSRYKDGTPKVFKVLGVRPYYDGAVWQELSLQET